MSAACLLGCPDADVCDLKASEADRCILWRHARERARAEAERAVDAQEIDRERKRASAKRIALRAAVRETIAEKGISTLEAQGILREILDGWHAERVLATSKQEEA